MSGFFGFNTALPERQQPAQARQQGFSGFASGNRGNDGTVFSIGGAGEEEDLAVYNWGEQTGNLMEDGDLANDETFGDVGEIR
jgi:DNA topoisomerase 2-associated protein PAT1